MYSDERHCKIRGDFSSSSTNYTLNLPYKDKSKIEPEVYALLLIEAMYAFTFSLRDNAITLCGSIKQANKHCPQMYHRSEESTTQLKKVLKDIRIPNPDTESDVPRNIIPFDSNGDGRTDIQVFAQQISNEDVEKPIYVEVFRFEKSNDPKAQDRLIEPDFRTPIFYKTINGKIRSFPLVSENCQHCKHLCKQGDTEESSSPIGVPTIILIAIAAVLVVAIIFLIFRKRIVRATCNCKSSIMFIFF